MRARVRWAPSLAYVLTCGIAVFLCWVIGYFVWLQVLEDDARATATVRAFARDGADWVGWGFGIGIAIGSGIHGYRRRRLAPEEGTRGLQHHRTALLWEFSPAPGKQWKDGDGTIYAATIEMLRRAHETHKADKRPVLEISVLVCSPSWDYPGRPDMKYWGDEFAHLLDTLGHCATITISCLPESTPDGFTPLGDFCEVLTEYWVQIAGGERSSKVESVRRGVTESFKQLRLARKKGNIRWASRPLHIPFQIVAIQSPLMDEAVVAFAGREILEDRNPRPKGFFSTDRQVVDAVVEIFRGYVAPHRRRPLCPAHTRGVISRATDDHQVTSFVGVPSTTIHVPGGTFSPYYGNSSKFTATVIQQVVPLIGAPKVNVLEIGAGTGVLSLGARAALGTRAARVHAVECFAKAFEALKSNTTAGGVTTERAALCAEVKDAEGPPEHVPAWTVIGSDDYAVLGAGLRRKIEKEIGRRMVCVDEHTGSPARVVGASLRLLSEKPKGSALVVRDAATCDSQTFELVIADLPFCDAVPTSHEEIGYVDLNHHQHQVLFLGVSLGKWLAPQGLLITSMSTLGGPEDVRRFEDLIWKHGLAVLQRTEFYEAGYGWIVYVLCRGSEKDGPLEVDRSCVPQAFDWTARLGVVGP